MTTTRTGIVAAALAVAALGLAGCGHAQQPAAAPAGATGGQPQSGPQSGQPQSELSSVQSTLDNVDKEMAGDDSP